MTAKLIKKGAPKVAEPPQPKKPVRPEQLRERWLAEKRAKSDQTGELRRKLFGR